MSGTLGLGKVSGEVFRRSVLTYISLDKEPELDGATISLTEHTVVAHSPSIGVPLEALGFFAFHYSTSNVACKFGRPTHLIIGIYLPLNTSEADLKIIARSLGEEARRYGVKITAGQTATYYGIETPLITSTCLGESTRPQTSHEYGDRILVIGDVGGEAVWLSRLSEGRSDESWRGFTPLQVALKLQESEGVKLLHDVSEGGLRRSLHEVAENLGLKLDVTSERIVYAEGVNCLDEDPLRVPSYGALVAVIDPSEVHAVEAICSTLGVPCVDVGEIAEGSGLYIDGVEEHETGRIGLDRIYGRVSGVDEIVASLESNLIRLSELPGIVDLIPQVGLNMVFSRPYPVDAGDVAGLSGRIVAAMGEALICGEVRYGASRFLASVVLEAARLDPLIRSAVNIIGGEDVERRLKAIGLRVEKVVGIGAIEGCPTAHFIRAAGVLKDAYIHPGSFGVEATTTILANEPDRLVEVLRELSKGA